MKFKTKMILITVAICAVFALGIVALGRFTIGFQNWNTDEWKLLQNNPENLYHSLEFQDVNGVIADGSNGISVKLDEENHSVRIRGTAEADGSYLIGTITLKANTTYVFDGGMDNGTAKTAYVSVINASTDEVIATSYTGPVLIKDITADTEIKIVVTILEEASLNLSIRPVLCVGSTLDDVVNYYK